MPGTIFQPSASSFARSNASSLAHSRALERLSRDAIAVDIQLVTGCVETHLCRGIALDPPDVAVVVAPAAHRLVWIHRRCLREGERGYTHPDRRDRGVDGLHGARRGC